jgi:hypothetical protein
MQRYYRTFRGPVIRPPALLPVRRFRPRGLLGTLAIGGLGYLIGRQQTPGSYRRRHWPQSSATSDQLAQLKLLGDLRESGVLTEEEFQEQKQKILQTS